MSRKPRKKARPSPITPRDFLTGDLAPLAVAAVGGLLLLGVAASGLLPGKAPAGLRSNGPTVRIRLSADAFAAPPTWEDLVVNYLGLDPQLVEPTRSINAGADGRCPAEPIALPADVLIALSPANVQPCIPAAGADTPSH